MDNATTDLCVKYCVSTKSSQWGSHLQSEEVQGSQSLPTAAIACPPDSNRPGDSEVLGSLNMLLAACVSLEQYVYSDL